MRGQGWKRGVRRLLPLVAACAAALVIVKHVSGAHAATTAAGGERAGRAAGATQQPPPRQQARTAPLAVLGPADVGRYRQAFALQREGRIADADRAVKALDDDVLRGHVLAERYLLPKAYKSGYGELVAWLERHAELPQAHRIYRLAMARRPKGAKAPAVPEGGFLAGAGQELREESFGGSFLRRWDVGIAAWRKGDYGRAAEQFTALVNDPESKGEELAAAAFWAGRSQLRIRRPQLVAGLLRKAARASDGFYGLLAQRLLDEKIRFDWGREEFRQEMAGLLLRYPAVRRAIALGQVGETNIAEGEVRKLAMRVDARDTQALTALAAALELPSAQMRLAQQLRLIDGRRHDGAMFPIPRWSPKSGFRLDRTLVYAITRAESAFDIEAESHRGALGLMQVMPDTGALVAKGLKIAYAGDEALLEPEMNLEIGQTWLRRLMKTDTIGDSLVHLIIAYNAGETRLKGWLGRELKGVPKQDPLLFVESVPLGETRGYTKKVLANLWAYQTRLGQPTPSLQALAENRWPGIEHLDPEAGLTRPPVAKPAAAAAATAASVATAPKAAVAAKAAPARKAKVVAKKRKQLPQRATVTKRRPGSTPPLRQAAAAGSLGKLRVHARAP
jgi:soluble lytic murein transglycosylase-like protein